MGRVTYDDSTPRDWPPWPGAGAGRRSPETGEHTQAYGLKNARAKQSSAPSWASEDDPTEIYRPQPGPRLTASPLRPPHLAVGVPTRATVTQRPPPLAALAEPRAPAPAPLSAAPVKAKRPAARPRSYVPATTGSLQPVERTDQPTATSSSTAASRSWLRNAALALGLIGLGFAARGAFSTVPPPSATAPAVSAAAALPETQAAPEPLAAEPAPVATLPSQPEPPTAATPAQLAKARRSAARAARIRERWLLRHASKHGAALATTAEAVAPDTVRDTTPPDAQPERAPERDPGADGATGLTGTLRINSRPWAQVYVDGELIGHTPQLALRLPAGQHSIRLVNDEMELSKTIQVFIEVGTTVTRVENLGE